MHVVPKILFRNSETARFIICRKTKKYIFDTRMHAYMSHLHACMHVNVTTITRLLRVNTNRFISIEAFRSFDMIVSYHFKHTFIFYHVQYGVTLQSLIHILPCTIWCNTTIPRWYRTFSSLLF